MYEPYPYKLDKIKISTFFLVVILLIAGIFILRRHPLLLNFSPLALTVLDYFCLFMLCLAGILSFRNYRMQYSREYFYIGTTALAALLFRMFFSYLYLSEIGFEIQQQIQLGSGLLFAIGFLLAAITSGEKVTINDRKKFVLRQWGILLGISLALAYAFFRFLSHGAVARIGVFRPSNLIAGSIAVLFLSAMLIMIYSYFKLRHVLFFWYAIAGLLLSGAALFVIFQQSAWGSYLLLNFAGLLAIGWLLLTENPKSMEAEIDLRNDLEKTLTRQQKRLENLQSLLDELQAGVCAVDRSGKITFANQGFNQLLGAGKKQVEGKTVQEFFDAHNQIEYQTAADKLHSGNPVQFEIEIKTGRGGNIPVIISANPVRDAMGRIIGSRWLLLENSDRKRNQTQLKDYSQNLEQQIKEKSSDLQHKTEELNRAKKYYDTLISGMLDILLVVDSKGNCTFINPHGKKLLGYEAKQLNSSRLPDFFSDMKRLSRNYGDAMKVELRDYEAPLKTMDGRTILCSWNVRYLFDSDGKNIGAMCVGRDVSEYKAMQKKLEQHSQHLTALVAERTRELENYVNQLSHILKIGEQIVLDADPDKVLANICKAIRSIGWRYVVFTARDELRGQFKVAHYAGIAAMQIRKFVHARNFLYQDPLKYFRDEDRISQSYLINSGSVDKKFKSASGFSQNSERVWNQGDVLVIPVKFKQKMLGFFSLFQPMASKYPDEQHIHLLETFAHKAAIAIENQRLFDKTRARTNELAEKNAIKTDLFTSMSHELRTPLNSIIVLSDVLQQQMSGTLNSEQAKHIRIIGQNGRDLLKIINNILELSKIDSGKMQPDFSYFATADMIEDNLRPIRPLCDRKKIKLETELGKNLPKYVFSDQDKINHILMNLLGNAVKFTPKGKIKLSVKFDKSASALHFAVADTGIGMTRSDAAKIFGGFERSDQAQRKQFEGAGLGLYIVKKLVDLLNGSITVESKKGKGTTFRFSAPVTDFRDSDKKSTLPPGSLEKMKLKPPPKKAGVEKPKVILLVDDHPDNHYAVNSILGEQGYRVVYADRGAKGIQLAQQTTPDLILMDMMMSGMDGYETTKKIRRLKKLKKIPIIAMTAKTVQEDQKNALKAGCNDYLTKPFSLKQILSKVQKWVGHANG